MKPETTGLIITTAALLVTVIGLLVTRQYGTRRGKAVVTWDSLPLVQTADLLEVRFGGTVVKDPYLVTISVVNHGPLDIVEESFPDGMLVLAVGPGSPLGLTGDPEIGVTMGQGRAFHIDAQHIAAKAPHSFSFVSEGPVESLELFSRLVNFDLTVVDPSDPQLKDALSAALTASVPSVPLASLAQRILNRGR